MINQLNYVGNNDVYEAEFNVALETLRRINSFRPDTMYMGEQTQLLDRIQSFIDNYQIEGPCGITRLMRWSPGTAKNVKDHHDRMKSQNGLKNKYKATTISRLLDDSHNRWRVGNFRDDFTRIENDVLSARAQGFTLDSDDEAALEVVQEFKEELNNANLDCAWRDNGILQYSRTGRESYYYSPRINMPQIIIAFPLEDIHLRLISGEEECVGVLPFGDINLFWEIDLYWWLNAILSTKQRGRTSIRYRDFDRSRFQNFNKIRHSADIKPYKKGLLHPYVQRHGNSYNAGNICFGSLQTSLYNLLLNRNFSTFKDVLHQWAQNFHMRDTGPLNGINQATIGFNKKWVGTSIGDRMNVDFNVCQRIYDNNYKESPEEMRENHCNDCTLTDRCTVYSEYLNPEEAEQREKALNFWEEMQEVFIFGIHFVNYQEDVYPFFSNKVKWEDDTSLDGYKDVCYNMELEYYQYCKYKHGCIITREDLDRAGLGILDMTDRIGAYIGEYRALSVEARTHITATYKSIYEANLERSTSE
tara:strand:- start:17350 stop:18939 length:1590 start_codon:yes stop_codon:yes gene_type:complete